MGDDLPAKTEKAGLIKSSLGLVEEWLAYKAMDGASAATVQTYRISLKKFVSWAAASDAREVTPATIVEYKGHLLARGYAVQTVNLRLTAVRGFFRYLVVTERRNTNPAAEVAGARRPKSKTHKRDALTDDEVLAVLDGCDASEPIGVRDRAMLTLMAYCGLREVEVHRLNVASVRTAGDRMVLDVHGKGRMEADETVVVPRAQERHVRMWMSERREIAPFGPSEPLFVSLSRRSFGGRLATRSIRQIVRGHFGAAGVVGARKTTHSLRHSAITRAIKGAVAQGRSPLAVQAMARHGSFDTTLGYYHEVDRLEAPAEDLISYEGELET